MINGAGWVLGSDYGGWKLANDYTSMPKDKANLLLSADLTSKPFFDLGWASPLADVGGSTWAEANHDQLLADAIPAMTLPAGGPGGEKMVKSLLPENVMDMQAKFTNGWPDEREGISKIKWLHSDLREVSFLYIFKLFDQLSK